MSNGSRWCVVLIGAMLMSFAGDLVAQEAATQPAEPKAQKAKKGQIAKAAPATQPVVHDLFSPEYDPPDCPAWAKEKLPEWILPYVGKNGMPESDRNKAGPLATSVKGIDRYQANWSINWRPETAEYLYTQYTPLTVNYVKGTLPTYEAVSAKYTAGATTDTEKAVALLTKALVDVCRHPGMPPRGQPTKPDRNLDDEALLKSGNGWCNEQARVFIRLCQVNNIPARMIHLIGQHHTIAEFYADGKWALADASNFFVAVGKDGKLLSVAECHDQGEGQRAYALAKKARMAELAAMSDEELNYPKPEQAEKFRKSALEFDAERLAARKDLAFLVVNTPLPPPPRGEE